MNLKIFFISPHFFFGVDPNIILSVINAEQKTDRNIIEWAKPERRTI